MQNISENKNLTLMMNKEWLIGFIEAEGCFHRNENQSFFELTQHISDIKLLVLIANFIGNGKIRKQIRKDGRSLAVLSISNRKILKEVIIPLCWNKFHSKKKYFQFRNWIEKSFPEIDTKYLVSNCQEIDRNWIVGFVDGDGSFYSVVSRNREYKFGYQIKLVFDITQVDTELELLKKIGETFFPKIYRWCRSKNIKS